MIFLKLSTAILCAALLSACQTMGQGKISQRQTGFEDASPRSILILPVVNHSVDVNAPLAVYSSLPVTLAEKGYYVYPSNTVKTILEYEGLYEPAEVHKLPTNKLAKMFDADVVLYVTIERWDTTYVLISSTTEVQFTYEFKKRDGGTIWKATKKMQYTPENNNSTGSLLGDLVGAIIVATVNRAAPNYMPLVNSANHQVFYTDHETHLPDGPYYRKEKN